MAVSTVMLFSLVALLLRRWDATIARWPVTRALSHVGAWSYSLYLVNFLAIGVMAQAINRVPALAAHRVVAFCCLVAGALVSGYAFYRCCERPFLKKSGRMTEADARTHAADAAAIAVGGQPS